MTIRNYHDVGNTASMRANLAALATCLDRLGRYEPATTIAGFAFNPPHRNVGSRDQHRDLQTPVQRSYSAVTRPLATAARSAS